MVKFLKYVIIFIVLSKVVILYYNQFCIQTLSKKNSFSPLYSHEDKFWQAHSF